MLYKHATAVSNTDAKAFVATVADESSVTGDVVEASVTGDVVEASETAAVRPPISSGPLLLHRSCLQQ